MPAWTDALYYFVFNLTRAVLAPMQPDSFIYWPFLLSSVVIALLCWAWWRQRDARMAWSGFRKRYFGAALWWHRSARADYRLYLVNALLFPALAGVALLNHDQVAARLGLMLGYTAPGPAVESVIGWRLAYTVLFYVAYDFGRFVAHSALHEIPLLWEFHKVHHSAEVLTPMTAYRAHPVDLLVMAWGGGLAAGVVAWAINHLAGGAVNAYVFMGLHVLLWASNVVGNLRHTPVWMTYGPTLGKWLISPAHHQLHHSREPRHLGCNRGFDIALWDRLHGTLYVPTGPEEQFAMGLDDGTTAQWQSVRHMLFAPFAGAARVLLGTRRPA